MDLGQNNPILLFSADGLILFCIKDASSDSNHCNTFGTY